MNFNDIKPFLEKYFDKEEVDNIISTISLPDLVEASNYASEQSLKIRQEYLETFLLKRALEKLTEKKLKEQSSISNGF